MGIEVTQNQVYEVIIYARVSNHSQKDDLQNQIKFLRDYANAKGYIVSEVITSYTWFWVTSIPITLL